MDGLLIPFQSATGRPLHAPAKRSEDPPHVARVVLHPALLLDQLGHAGGSPQARVVPEPLGAALQTRLDPAKICFRQSRLASCASGLPKGRTATFSQLLGPAIHRLSVDADLATDFRLGQSLLEQPGCFHASFFQRVEVASNSSRVSHAGEGTTIQDKCHYIMLFSIVARCSW